MIELHLTACRGLVGVCIFVHENKLITRPILLNHIFRNPTHNKKPSTNTREAPDNVSNNFNKENSLGSKDISHNDIGSTTENPREFKPKEIKTEQKTWEKLFLLKTPILNLLQAVPQIFSLREISIKGNWGGSNPMLTGIVYGVQQIVSSFLFNRIKVDLTPSFQTVALKGIVRIKVQLYIIQFVFFIFRFIIHLLYLRLRDKFGNSAINLGKAVN